MPLYEYECASCQKVHEVIQKFSDAPLSDCPDCKGPVTKLVSMSSFALKGSGWYTTDYKRKAAAPTESGEKVAPVTQPASASTAPAPAATSQSTASPAAPASTTSTPSAAPKASGGSSAPAPAAK